MHCTSKEKNLKNVLNKKRANKSKAKINLQL